MCYISPPLSTPVHRHGYQNKEASEPHLLWLIALPPTKSRIWRVGGTHALMCTRGRLCFLNKRTERAWNQQTEGVWCDALRWKNTTGDSQKSLIGSLGSTFYMNHLSHHLFHLLGSESPWIELGGNQWRFLLSNTWLCLLFVVCKCLFISMTNSSLLIHHLTYTEQFLFLCNI